MKENELRNELRFGNYIQDKQGNKGYLIQWNSKNMVSIKKQFSTCTDHIDEFKPIPLTEELLLKCGAKEVSGERFCDMHDEFEECNYYYLGNLKLYYNPETSLYYDDGLLDYINGFEYLHTLQNFFALTNQELKINL